MKQVAQQSDIVSVAGVDVTPKFANIAIASSGDNIIVAAVSGKKIRVLNGFMISNGTVVAYFVDGANTAIAGDGTNGISLIANSGFSLPFSPVGWFETGSGQSLDINLDGAVIVGGSLAYIEV